MIHFTSGVEFRQSRLSGENQFPFALSTTKVFTNVLPRMAISYNDPDNRYAHLSYLMTSSLPSIQQMQNVVDNSNPLLLSTGAPDLKQAVAHVVTATYSENLSTSDGFVFASADMRLTSDYIGQRTDVARTDTVIDGVNVERGVQLIRPVNIHGAIQADVVGTTGFRVDTLPLRASLSVNARYSKTPGLVNGVRNEAMMIAGSVGGNVEYDIASYLSIGGGISYRRGGVDNSTQIDLNNTYSNLSYRGELTLRVSDGCELLADIRSRDLEGLSGTYNQDVVLLNIAIKQFLFPDKRGHLRLSVRDALNQGNVVSRQFTDAYTEDQVSLVLRRVILLTFSYRFLDS